MAGNIFKKIGVGLLFILKAILYTLGAVFRFAVWSVKILLVLLALLARFVMALVGISSRF